MLSVEPTLKKSRRTSERTVSQREGADAKLAWRRSEANTKLV